MSSLSSNVQDASTRGHKITEIGILACTPLPQPGFVPFIRVLMPVLEATFTYGFWALRRAQDRYTYKLGHLCPWPTCAASVSEPRALLDGRPVVLPSDRLDGFKKPANATLDIFRRREATEQNQFRNRVMNAHKSNGTFRCVISGFVEDNRRFYSAQEIRYLPFFDA
ncbi:hypothetical protein V8F33_006241 [Rhypophila sp. PSN 637]